MTVDVAQLVRASVCGTESRGFESRLPPCLRSLTPPRTLVFMAAFFVMRDRGEAISRLPPDRVSIGHREYCLQGSDLAFHGLGVSPSRLTPSTGRPMATRRGDVRLATVGGIDNRMTLSQSPRFLFFFLQLKLGALLAWQNLKFQRR